MPCCDEPAQVFVAKHATDDKKERWLSGNSVFFRMHRISDVYFVGGFGTVQVWRPPAASPDCMCG